MRKRLEIFIEYPHPYPDTQQAKYLFLHLPIFSFMPVYLFSG